MKYLLCLLLLACCVAHAQMRNANAIEVKGVSFKEVVSAILEKGIHIDKIDSVQQTIKTEPTPVKRNGVVLATMYIRLKDSTATITGVFDIEGAKDSYTVNIANKGVNGSPLKSSFLYMDQFAASLNKPLEYKVTD